MVAEARITQDVVEALVLGDSKARITQAVLEGLVQADSIARVTQVCVEALVTVVSDPVIVPPVSVPQPPRKAPGHPRPFRGLYSRGP